MDIAGKTFLVTGGASGLGGACVRELHGAGANVVILDLAPHGEDLAKELGAKVKFAKTDVTSEADVLGAIKVAMDSFGAVHGAINCAGIATAERAVGKSGPQPLANFTKVVTINAIGTFNVIRLVAAEMMKRAVEGTEDRGVIIMTASVAAFDGQIGQVAYTASKGAVAAMTLPLAREFSQNNIRVCTIAPGTFDTPMMAGLPEEARISLGKQTPFPPRLGNPKEYAALARHIIENQMLNGETIRLDGSIRMAPR